MDLMMRRRALMGMGGKPTVAYAITKESNPVQMAQCYNKGWAASPDYMTIDDALAVNCTQTEFAEIGCGNMDLRYFRNITRDNTWNGLWSNPCNNAKYNAVINGTTYQVSKIIAEGKPLDWNGKGIGLSTSWMNPVYVLVVFPDTVTTLSTNYMEWKGSNSSANVLILVFEATTPPTIVINGNGQLTTGKSRITKIYVPDGSVDAYKSASYWSDYAELIDARSNYVEPNVFTDK
jgi:hypothetical protein